MSASVLNELRGRHPALVYERYHAIRRGDDLVVTFHFHLLPDIHFSPSLTLEGAGEVVIEEIAPYLFHLGMVESISYWKAACPAILEVRAGPLSEDAVAWWQDLYLHGLGEFYYRNSIDCVASPLVTIVSAYSGEPHYLDGASVREGALVMVGGGKDSSLTLELMRPQAKVRPLQAFALNPTRAALDSAALVGLTKPLIATRSIDPTLLSLNAKGYLNGHTPFSAYLAFLSTLVGRVHGYTDVIASNERSANDGNVMFKGMSINHQYSKSYRFEALVRGYIARYLTPKVHYWSFLRPLHDLQISALFARYSLQLCSFRSCNVNQRKDSWCGRCPKCAFVYLSLFPFVEPQFMQQIFGMPLFERAEIVQYIRELVGLSPVKPFECVGGIEESRAALCMAVHRHPHAVPPELRTVLDELPTEVSSDRSWIDQLLSDWNGEHFLPAWAEEILRRQL